MEKLAESLIALQLTPQVGEKTLRRLISQGDERIFAAWSASEEALRDQFGLHSEAARYFARHREKLRKDAELLLSALHRASADLLVAEDPRCPPRLKKLADAPPLLYVSGDVPLLQEPCVCFLASSTAGDATVHRLRTLADRLAREGFPIITGHNRKVYQSAALAAAQVSSPVIYVLDCGLFSVTATGQDHPFSTARIHPAKPQRRAFLSPFRPKDPWIGHNNQKRDHLITAMASFIVAVDIRPGGVMERECKAALKRGQRVVALAPEGRLPGTHSDLFEKGAMLIQTEEELIRHLWDAGLQPPSG